MYLPGPTTMTTDEPLIAAIAAHGLLLLQDPELANAVALLAGQTVRGSWWAHPRANAFYEALTRVEAHPDVLAAKLVAGKVTFVHRRLWPALLAVGICREPWQVGGLPRDSTRLLAELDAGRAIEPAGEGARVLEQRLLARAETIHSAGGKHVLRLEPWTAWAARVGCRAVDDVTAAKALLEAALVSLGGAMTLLPWRATGAAKPAARGSTRS
ncbi:MAG: hypothetical protein JWM82_1749 [Myxococcales bacterium]|nr:hypothetical protein [Myxococcales bacterium]